MATEYPVCPVCKRLVLPAEKSITMSAAGKSATLHDKCWQIRVDQILRDSRWRKPLRRRG